MGLDLVFVFSGSHSTAEDHFKVLIASGKAEGDVGLEVVFVDGDGAFGEHGAVEEDIVKVDVGAGSTEEVVAPRPDFFGHIGKGRGLIGTGIPSHHGGVSGHIVSPAHVGTSSEAHIHGTGGDIPEDMTVRAGVCIRVFEGVESIFFLKGELKYDFGGDLVFPALPFGVVFPTVNDVLDAVSSGGFTGDAYVKGEGRRAVFGLDKPPHSETEPSPVGVLVIERLRVVFMPVGGGEHEVGESERPLLDESISVIGAHERTPAGRGALTACDVARDPREKRGRSFGVRDIAELYAVRVVLVATEEEVVLHIEPQGRTLLGGGERGG